MPPQPDMQALEARLRTLEDKEAIRALIASYGQLADAGDADGLAARWHMESSYAVSGMAHALGRPAVIPLSFAGRSRDLKSSVFLPTAGCLRALLQTTV